MIQVVSKTKESIRVKIRKLWAEMTKIKNTEGKVKKNKEKGNVICIISLQ